MREFKTRFTADISSYKQQMSEMRNATGQVGSAIKGMMVTAAAGVGGWSLASAIKETVRLGGELQNTTTSFEVMMGSARRAEQVLAQLNKFADVTPFDNEEVIRSGRVLLNVGVSVDNLNSKLKLLGNIASGVGAPLIDIVNIYAKAANKGKVQAEELAQLSERGVPVLQALSKTLGVTTEEIMDLGSKGKLSFALLEEALQSLGGAGGQYFGLMEKQSQNFLAKVDGIKIAVRNFAMDVGSRSLPALTKIADEVIAKIAELSDSGQLEASAQRLADALGKTATAIRDLAVWLAKNKDGFIALGKAALYYTAWIKLNSAINLTRKTLAALSAGNVVADLRNSSETARLFTTNLQALTRTIGGVRTGLLAIGPATAVAFAGWELGKFLGNLLDVEKALTRIELRKQGKSAKEIDDLLDDKPAAPVKASVQGRDLAADEERKAQLKKEIAELEQQAGNSAAKPLRDQAAAKRKELDELEKASEDYKKKAEAQIAQIGELTRKKAAAEKKKNELDKKVKEARDLTAAQSMMAGLHDPGSGIPAPQVSFGEVDLKKQHEAAYDEYKRAEADLAAALQTKAEYEASLKKLDESKKKKAADQAASDKFRADQAREKAEADKKEKEKQAELEKQRKRTEQQVADARKAVAKARQDLADEDFRDAMSEKIDAWRKNIAKYQADIDRTNAKLSRFGVDANSDILKSKEQIKQEQADAALAEKIAAHNRGERVRFNQSDKKRLEELKKEQQEARRNQRRINQTERQIDRAEGTLDQRDKQRRGEDRKDRRAGLDQKEKNLSAAEQQLKAAKAANAPLEKALKDISEILRNGLPNGD
ncbi:tape measure protein [Victivallis vadensis]|uniref:tape measure protein n=1 Tax=Victivallis vadensis TaxID=172901 RepID=UPI003AF69CCF